MKKATLVVMAAAALLLALGSPANAAPATTSSSYGIEGAYGLEGDGVWYSVYSLAYDVTEDGDTTDIVAPTVFVDGPNHSLECSAFTDEGDVDVDPSLSGGAYAATLEGLCFDFLTEESVPFTISVDVTAVGTSRPDTRGGSYYDDGLRCISQRSSSDALTIATIGISIPDRGLQVEGDVADEFSSLTGFTSRCYPAEGPKQNDDH